MRMINTTINTTNVEGKFVTFKNETYYKIENYNAMTDFFMTITSSSDVWNFLWSKGGITAGRENSEFSIFPYGTADKLSDMKHCTGSYTAIKIKTTEGVYLWTPFSEIIDWNIQRNIYKNGTGSKVWFEEINKDLNIIFRYGWTSSNKYGLVRKAEIENISNKQQTLCFLDGCRNLMPACVTAALQKDNSVLVDAYKKTDLDTKTGLVILGMSSVLTDKAEPSEALRANTCWFSTETPIYLKESTITNFETTEGLPTCTYADDIDNKTQKAVLKGKRPSSFITKEITLEANKTDSWYQVFNTSLDLSSINVLNDELSNRKTLTANLEKDIEEGQKLLEHFIKTADGFQNTADQMSCIHHEANVMFNIMRGGVIVNNGEINKSDFLDFVSVRNKDIYTQFLNHKELFNSAETISHTEFEKKVTALKNNQMTRMYLEYMPLTFSRRHGDPSRPWNNFSIKTQHKDGSKILNYEGNWRDIFQNWEALAFSYPKFTNGMIAKFLNAMTTDGFNPYHISRDGLDWEIPDPDNPWSNIGYWNDHQVIYLCKLLELQFNIDSETLLLELDTPLFSSSNIPYKIKSFKNIIENPRDTIDFDYKLNNTIQANVSKYGTDAKLVCDKNGLPILTSMTSKLLQILVAKMANFVPEGGIWMNTQRPEWNDANNALAGYGLSMVTVCYLRRYTSFLVTLFESSTQESFKIPTEIANLFSSLAKIYSKKSPENTCSEIQKATLVNECGLCFETERNTLYSDKCFESTSLIFRTDILKTLDIFKKHLDNTINKNEREDGLFHSYNTLAVKENGKKIQVNHLDAMLEGQVAILSSGAITPEKAANTYEAMMNSCIREKKQYSYTLYPNKTLAFFTDKNCINRQDAEKIRLLQKMLQENDTRIVVADATNTQIVHFNTDFRNVDILKQKLVTMNETAELENICLLYEKTFSHQSFTGRSGTFYAYEGLGSIYWHMVSKLLLAIQENILVSNGKTQQRLKKAYYDVRKGLGYNKTPELYGAFPSDPYSHTPENQGAKQPGMTGQVKEEIITRWGELGIFIQKNKVVFNPILLQKKEFDNESSLTFTRFGCEFTYKFEKSNSINISVNGGPFKQTTTLSETDSKELFARSKTISSIEVHIPESFIV